MTQEKFLEDATTVYKFIQCYCDNEHVKEKKSDGKIELIYNGENLDCELNYTLCAQCASMLEYSHKRLKECPKENKPRCRKCSDPCYEKSAWKKLSKIMRYSGFKLGLLKVKKLFT